MTEVEPKSELEKALDSRYEYQYESDYDDAGYDYTGEPPAEQYGQHRIGSTTQKPQKPINYCQYCGKSIQGKYIKFKKKDEMGNPVEMGPFCSQDCAKLYGK